MIKKFQKLGFKISYDEVRKVAKGEIGRPHIAKVILKNNPDKISSFDEIFDRYLAVGKKAYVEREEKISVRQAIKAVHAAKGLAFIAHPGVYDFDVEKFILYFKRNKGDGIETIYNYTKSRRKATKKINYGINKKFKDIAKKYELLETGGSDFHGEHSHILGDLEVPYSVLDALKKQRISR